MTRRREVLVPRWFTVIDAALRSAITWFCSSLLVLMVVFTVYTVVMRYVFHDPPFWGDTIALLCNTGLVFTAYALAVREREDIASEALHSYLPTWAVTMLTYMWEIVTIAFGIFLAWFGWEAASTVPGQFWELGGLPKSLPMMVLPLSGLLVAMAGVAVICEMALGWRSPQ